MVVRYIRTLWIDTWGMLSMHFWCRNLKWVVWLFWITWILYADIKAGNYIPSRNWNFRTLSVKTLCIVAKVFLKECVVIFWPKPFLLKNNTNHLFLNFCVGSTRVYWRKRLKISKNFKVGILAALDVEVHRILWRFSNFLVFIMAPRWSEAMSREPCRDTA